MRARIRSSQCPCLTLCRLSHLSLSLSRSLSVHKVSLSFHYKSQLLRLSPLSSTDLRGQQFWKEWKLGGLDNFTAHTCRCLVCVCRLVFLPTLEAQRERPIQQWFNVSTQEHAHPEPDGKQNRRVRARKGKNRWQIRGQSCMQTHLVCV
jgi:hypothetical protein